MWRVALACALVASQAGAFKHRVREMDLDLVKLYTVCPVETGEDVDENRIPEIIKSIKCGPSLNPVCEDRKTACCDNSFLMYHTECVQVVDFMLVRYKNRGDDFKLHKYQVHVGCNCMLQTYEEAFEDRSGLYHNVSNIFETR